MIVLSVDPKVFLDDAISTETRELNLAIVEKLQHTDIWSVTPEEARQARREGKGPFPLEEAEPTAVDFDIEGPEGPLSIRRFTPRNGATRGTFLHIHGGGWTIGGAANQDVRLQEIADNCSLMTLSVEYRLAPEHPNPAGPDDCEAAALWLLDPKNNEDLSFLAIGGESAGAHLAVMTLLRLRDKHQRTPFHAAMLMAGCYDLGQTASAKNWGDEKLVLNSRDMRLFSQSFLQSGEDMRHPSVSPLYAPLHDLPPALFSIGTRDPLLDDSLQMSARWHACNGNAVLDVVPGGCHMFHTFRHTKIAGEANARIDDFFNGQRG